MEKKQEKKAEMRISDAELSLIKMTFAENDTLLKILRKIFLPEISAEAQIGQNFDLWMTLQLDNLPPDQAIINIKARNTVISHVENCLVQLKLLAGIKNETVEETKERLQKDSSK